MAADDPQVTGTPDPDNNPDPDPDLGSKLGPLSAGTARDSGRGTPAHPAVSPTRPWRFTPSDHGGERDGEEAYEPP